MQVGTPCGQGRGTRKRVKIFLWDRSNTDYALSRSNLGYNFVRNPAHYNLGVRNTFPAGSPAGYLGRGVQRKGSEGPSIAAGRDQPVNASDSSFVFPASEMTRAVDMHFSFDNLRITQDRSAQLHVPCVSTVHHTEAKGHEPWGECICD